MTVKKKITDKSTDKRTDKRTDKSTDENNTDVVVYLDRPRFVKFGHKALKKLSKLTNLNMDEINGDFDMEDLEKVMWCGLLADSKERGEDLKLEDMEDLLDMAESFGDVVEAMQEALKKAFQKTEKQKN